MSYITKEPVRFWAAITGVIEAVIPVLILFGIIDWSADQIAAVMLLVAAIGTLFAFFFVREQVTPWHPDE